jgi:hypothetical protein
MRHDQPAARGSTSDDVGVHIGWERWKPRWGRVPMIVVIGSWLILTPTLIGAVFGLAFVVHTAVTEGVPGMKEFALLALVSFVLITLVVVWSAWLFRVTRTYWLLRQKEYADEENGMPPDSGRESR